jgi:hypothetical protein
VSSASTSNIPGNIGQDSRKLQMPATWYGQVVSDGTVSYHIIGQVCMLGLDLVQRKWRQWGDRQVFRDKSFGGIHTCYRCIAFADGMILTTSKDGSWMWMSPMV